MCEFHLKGQCFHPEKTTKGIVATNCKFQNCSDCTNKHWQQNMVEENYNYYESIVKIADQQRTKLVETQDNTNSQERKPLLTRIFSAKY